jgi:hypothetical protein
MAQQTNELDAVAALAGEPHTVAAAGVTRTNSRLLTIENPSPFVPSKQSRLVIVADDQRAARATLDAIRWFKTRAPQRLRDEWAVSALLLAYGNDATPAQQLEFPPVKGFFDHPEQPESRYAWRWATYQAPDLLLQIRGGDVLSRGTPPAGSLAAAMAGGTEIGTVPVVFGTARESDGATLLQQVLGDVMSPRTSEIRATISARTARESIRRVRWSATFRVSRGSARCVSLK